MTIARLPSGRAATTVGRPKGLEMAEPKTEGAGAPDPSAIRMRGRPSEARDGGSPKRLGSRWPGLRAGEHGTDAGPTIGVSAGESAGGDLDSVGLYLQGIRRSGGRNGGPAKGRELPCCAVGRAPGAGRVFRCAALRSPDAAPCGLVLGHLRLVVSLARRYERFHLPLGDLIQEGNVGLLHAVRNYDPKRHGRFASHAANCIKREICRALSQARTIHIPQEKLDRRRQLARVAGDLEQRAGNEAGGARPRPKHRLEDDAREIGVEPEELREVLLLVPEVASLDAPGGPDGEVLADRVADTRRADPSEEAEDSERRRCLREAVAGLPPRYRRLVERRYGLDGGGEARLADLAEEFEVSIPRVHQLLAKAVKQLRAARRFRPSAG